MFLIDREPAPQDRIAAPRPDGKPWPQLKPGQHPGGVLMALDRGTGKDVPWEFERSYGCGQIAWGRHLMVFRSATLGYRDLSPGAEMRYAHSWENACRRSA